MDATVLGCGFMWRETEPRALYMEQGDMQVGWMICQPVSYVDGYYSAGDLDAGFG
jgi:hypothetical protein